MARGNGVVKGGEYTPYPHTPVKRPDYRDINPDHRSIPVTGSALRQTPIKTYSNIAQGDFRHKKYPSPP